MLSEEEFREWWNWKIENYLKNYARRNKLTLAQARAKFFTEMHEKLEVVPIGIKIFLENRSWLELKINITRFWCKNYAMVVEQTYLSESKW